MIRIRPCARNAQFIRYITKGYMISEFSHFAEQVVGTA
uniref:Uncharacterized protein n=1 Tax=Arundo donax TaxID=35708 RepID=A0A0A9AJM3_ARUDO